MFTVSTKSFLRLLVLLTFAPLLFACGGGDSASGDPGVVTLNVQDIEVSEAAGVANLSLQLNVSSATPVSVDYATRDYTALEVSDFLATVGTVTFAVGETQKTIAVPVIDDSMGEATELFSLILSNPHGATLGNSSANVLIRDDDPLETVATYSLNWGTLGVFTQAATCGLCHRASDPGVTPAVMRYPDANGEDISPANQWRHSMMAHAFDDPYTQAKIQDEVNLFSSMAGFIEDKCLTCHSPMGRTHAQQSGDGLSNDNCLLVAGCYRYDTAVTDMSAREGVSCTLCHKIQEKNLGTSASFSGNFVIADVNDVEAFTIYGPYQDPHPGGSNAMVSQSGNTPVFGNQVTQSAHCATCHTLYTPTLNVNTGDVTGTQFLEQGVFLEWQNSLYSTGNTRAAQCQDCHMRNPAPGAYATRIALTPSGSVNANWPEREPFYTHGMVGGNTYVLALLKRYRNLLGIDATTSEAGFAEKIAQSQALLQAAASLNVTGQLVATDQLNVDVTVMNATGHKLPTAYPSRRVWLHLTVQDGNAAVVFESGAANSMGRLVVDNASLQRECLLIDKPDGFNSNGCFEPHHDVITDPAQVQIYETVLADTNNDITHVLLHAAGLLKDNRLPPVGFTDANAQIIEAQTLPVGVAGDADFNPVIAGAGSGSDVVHYRINTAGQSGPYLVTVRLLYQSVRPSFVYGMRSDLGRVNRFKAMYEQVPPVVEVMHESIITIP